MREIIDGKVYINGIPETEFKKRLKKFKGLRPPRNSYRMKIIGEVMRMLEYRGKLGLTTKELIRAYPNVRPQTLSDLAHERKDIKYTCLNKHVKRFYLSQFAPEGALFFDPDIKRPMKTPQRRPKISAEDLKNKIIDLVKAEPGITARSVYYALEDVVSHPQVRALMVKYTRLHEVIRLKNEDNVYIYYDVEYFMKGGPSGN